MKFIYYTNNIILALTVLGYSMLFPGLMMQVVLGGIQVLFFLVLLFNFNKFSKKIKTHLLIYCMLTIFCLSLYYGSSPKFGKNLFSLIMLPMGIASYFTYIVYKLNQTVL
ncbi:hypothetical protein [Kordia sp.]|uniref:hypothetical protein n=1 Tax=Kordia sp. TaxID=1965332 RepID=UPI0025BDDA7C|nr:hypothetical protein [Kordia sp.]MCH2194078.1 hypothetical protein [Kordia sp.]